MLRILLDTDVVYCAVFSNGASSIIFDDIVESKYELLVSNPLLTEYEKVLTREIGNKIDEKHLKNVMNFFAGTGIKTDIYFLYRLMARENPRGFLLDYQNGIIDEIQKEPELFQFKKFLSMRRIYRTAVECQ